MLQPDNSPLFPVSAHGVPLKGVVHQLHDSPLPHWAGRALAVSCPGQRPPLLCCLAVDERGASRQSTKLHPWPQISSAELGETQPNLSPPCKQIEPTVPATHTACLGRKLSMSRPATVLLAFRLSVSFVALPVKMCLLTSAFPRKSFHSSLKKTALIGTPGRLSRLGVRLWLQS